MTREIENISSALFDKIRTRFNDVRLGDDKAKATTDPEKARYFNFNYTVDGKKFGNLTVSLIDENSLKIYYAKDIISELDEHQQQDWFQFLRGLRQFAKRNLLSFDTRDINKSNLQLKDVKQQSKADGVLSTDDVQVSESRMFGTRRSSYQECGPVKIMIRHRSDVDETKRGARTRNIEHVFLETAVGERFLLPFKNLHGARAMAQHLSQGGRIDDELSEGICGMVSEMNSMSHFCRATSRRQFEDTETSNMAQAAVQRYSELKNRLRHIGSTRGYQAYRETYMPENDISDDVDVDALKERFVKKIYDDRFNDALPYVYRAYQQQKESMNTAMAEEFENWADQMVEGTWATPDEDDDVTELDELMSNTVEVGPNAENATSLLYNIIGSDELFDHLAAVADAEGQEADARPTIIKWLRDHSYTELADRYDQQYTQNTDALQQQAAVEPDPNAAPAQTTGATTADAPNMESADPLEFMRMLAGLK